MNLAKIRWVVTAQELKVFIKPYVLNENVKGTTIMGGNGKYTNPNYRGHQDLFLTLMLSKRFDIQIC